MILRSFISPLQGFTVGTSRTWGLAWLCVAGAPGWCIAPLWGLGRGKLRPLVVAADFLVDGVGVEA